MKLSCHKKIYRRNIKIKIAIRYQSRGGNTKVVAETIAAAAGVKAEPISVPLEESVDVLFIGGGVYAWDIDKSLISYLESLSPETVKSAAVFTTAGGMDKTGRISAILSEKDIAICKETLPVKMFLRNHAALGGKGQIELSDKKISSINDFVKRIIRPNQNTDGE